MYVYSKNFEHNGQIPARLAYGTSEPGRRFVPGGNRNPNLEWSDLPAGTRSLAVICHDPDAPATGDDVNVEGAVVAADRPRTEFYHWVLIDVDPTLAGIAEGEYSDGITPGGKPGPEAPFGARQGTNGYKPYFAGDAEMAGEYYGYDGPCPPWNDELPHRYVFTVYAVDVERLPVEETFDAPEVLRILAAHSLGSAELIGRYATNLAVDLAH